MQKTNIKQDNIIMINVCDVDELLCCLLLFDIVFFMYATSQQ